MSTPGGLYAVGGDWPRGKGPRADRAVIWHSQKGAGWATVANLRKAAPSDIASGPDDLIVVGDRIPRQGKRVPTAWHSSDGSRWQAKRLDDKGPTPRKVAVSEDGMAQVLGQDYLTDGPTWTRLWRSGSDRRWQRIELPGGLDERQLMDVEGPVASPRGFLLLTREHEQIVDRLWHSADGLEWHEVPMPEGWALERSWVLVQPWPWRGLIVPARTLPGGSQQPSLLLTADGGQTWCVSDGPRKPGFFAFDVASSPDGSVIMVGHLFPKGSRIWAVRPAAAPGSSESELPFPCEPAPVADVLGAPLG